MTYLRTRLLSLARFFTGFNLSRLSEVQFIKSITTEDTNPTGVEFNNDGTKLFVCGVQNSSIYEYHLSLPYDLSTISIVQVTKSVALDDTTPRGIEFNANGSKIFMVGGDNISIYEYNLSTPFDLNTITVPSAATRSVATEDILPTGIAFNNNGSKIFMIGNSNDSVYEYNLGTPYDITTMSGLQATASIATEDTNAQGVEFNNDGSKLFIVGGQNDSVYEYVLGIPYTISTISAVQATASVNSEDTFPRCIAFDGTGGKLFVVGSDNDSLYEYGLAGFIGYSLNNLSFQQTKSISSQDTFPAGIVFTNDGTKMFMAGIQNASIYEYTLSTPYDISTLLFQHSESVATEDDFPQEVTFNNDGCKMFVVGNDNMAIYEYDLSIPFDLITKSVVKVTRSVATEDTAPTGLTFNSTGSKVFVVGVTNDSIYEYDLSTPFDLSTKSGVVATKSVSPEDTAPHGIIFNAKGSKIFVVGAANDSIYEYNLGTPYDINTMSLVKVIKSVTIEDDIPRGIAFNGNGSKIFVVGDQNNSIYAYNL